jgi:hypothetical protein
MGVDDLSGLDDPEYDGAFDDDDGDNPLDFGEKKRPGMKEKSRNGAVGVTG